MRTRLNMRMLAGLIPILLVAAACSPRLQPPGPEFVGGEAGLYLPVEANPTNTANPPNPEIPVEAAALVVPGPAHFYGDHLVQPDGTALPLRTWRPEGPPSAVVLALHGFNDHSLAFDLPGTAWAEQGLLVLAYDQRGFGGSPHRGIWAGWERMAADLWSAAAAIGAEYPDLPLFLVGESMGAAVILSAFSAPMVPARQGAGDPAVAGAILSAPAVWGRATMPPVYRWGLWVFANTLPWHPVSGSGLRRRASDNDEALRQLWSHPLAIRYTRTDSVWGLVNLMDVALASAGRIDVPVLTLYGERDEIVPPGPVARMRERLPETADHRRYPDGWHLLFRDLGAQTVWDETAAWMLAQAQLQGP